MANVLKLFLEIIYANGKPFILQISANSSDNALALSEYLQTPSNETESKFERLIKPLATAEFFDRCWENMCVHIARGASPTNTDCANIFSLQQLHRIVQTHKLSYQHNMTLCQYTNGTRSDLSTSGNIKSSQLTKSFDNMKLTIQFYQPQRFSDALWGLQADMERIFGCLAGASAYITPAQSQGLAPHYDDVCVFIIQTEGSKTWRLYAPSSSIQLAEHAKSVPREQLGEPCVITLHPGDVLYLPRGTVHEAVTDAAVTHSTHVTVSVYQKYNYKEYLGGLLPALLEKAFQENVEYRRGLPRDLLSFGGTYAAFGELLRFAQEGQRQAAGQPEMIAGTIDNTIMGVSSNQDKRKEFRARLSALLVQLCAHLDNEVIDQTTDLLAEDFLMHRLPLPNDLVPSERPVVKMGKRSELRLCNPQSMRAMIQQKGSQMVLRIAQCRRNGRMQHMGHPLPQSEDDKEEESSGSGSEESQSDSKEEEEDDNSPWIIELPAVYANLIFFLQFKYPEYTSVSELSRQLKEGITTANLKQTLTQLYGRGVIDLKSS